MPDAFKTLVRARNVFANGVITDVCQRIDSRPHGPRNQPSDDVDVFGPLNTATAMLLSVQEYAIAKHMFHECYDHALAYEQQNAGSEIHKGAPAFNMGVVCLRSYDFVAAMQYLELAELETQRTTGSKNWNIFLNPLFDSNFWDTVDAAATVYPIPLYQELWKSPWGKQTVKANWRRVSTHSKLLLLINIAQRIRYRQLIDRSQFPKSDSIALAYWNLCADLARLLETEIKRRAKLPPPKPYQLYALLTQGFTGSRIGNVSTEVQALHTAHGVNSTPTFNAAFPHLEKAIVDPNRSTLERVGAAAYLHYATRNQVQHHVDKALTLYRRPERASFTVDVLLTLCRLDSWTS